MHASRPQDDDALLTHSAMTPQGIGAGRADLAGASPGHPTRPRGIPGLLWVRWTAITLLVAASCNSVRLPPPPPADSDPAAAAEASSKWRDMPVSWEKLNEIEIWLAQPNARNDEQLWAEAWLQLSEGRLELAEADSKGSNVPSATVRIRLESAQDGFDTVLGGTGVAPGQRTRAEIGRQMVRALLARPQGDRLPLVVRSTWAARPARTAKMDPLRGTWARATVHHSADTLSSSRSGGSFAHSVEILRRIQRYHMDEPSLAWGDIGYHFIIDPAGRLFEGRRLDWQGAHAGGDNNIQNIGICVLGDFSAKSSSPTPAALKSLDLLLNHLRKEYRFPASRVKNHHDYKVTECPGPALTSWVKRYQTRR